MSEPEEIDFVEQLGADDVGEYMQITCFVPDKDKNGNLIADLKRYVDLIVAALIEMGKGCTLLPEAEGFYSEDANPLTATAERTQIISCDIREPDTFLKTLFVLRKALHLFGKECSQNEVMVKVAGLDGNGNYFDRSYFIRKYD